MIETIQVKNSIVFDSLDLALHKGLNVFSGVSGSGKSVFMEILLAIFGIGDVNAQQIQALITNLSLDLESILLDHEEEIIVNIVKKEKVRYFINTSLIAKKSLQEVLSPSIKYISLKNATELLPYNLLKTLDNLIGTKEKKFKSLIFQLETKFQELQEAKKAYHQILQEEKNIQELKDLANFEIQKITSIAPKINEYEELMQLKKDFSKKEKLQSQISQALEVMQEIHQIQNALQALDKIHPAFEESIIEVRDILVSENERLEELDTLDPESMLDRISKLSELNQRYGSIQGALDRLEYQKSKLLEYDNLHFNKEKLFLYQEEIEKECKTLAQQISKYRNQYLENFTQELQEICHLLKLSNIRVLLEEIPLISSGVDAIKILLKNTEIPNLSMGEYNRLRLAIMYLETKFSTKTGILILDEIDANLSGEESEGVAKILKQLASSYQIFAISHQPHIPALADQHYLVYKQDSKSYIKILDLNGKVQEIARMISGADITQEAIDFAKKRLGI
ncbi:MULTISPECIES: DNA recombination protein RecN [unclassified Helicobacter]|uniref:DNA recombination protein RecN n=1 Tax=unclassified Helicobacter TaxID=2593540 RepID=UPI000CF10B81|nr:MULTISPECIES: DNA recombination protein RecN [unclassified Helicobacter]